MMQMSQGEARDPFIELVARLEGAASTVALGGLSGAGAALVAARLLRERDEPLLIVAPTGDLAERFASDLRALAGNLAKTAHASDGALAEGGPADPTKPGPVLLVPEDPVLPFGGLSPDHADLRERLRVCHALIESPREVRAVVVSARTLLRRVLPPATMQRHTLLAMLGAELDRAATVASLLNAGYQQVPLCEDPGTFAVRGAIIDVFGPLAELPFRIELLGDEVDRIRAYDPATQRTVAQLESVSLPPVREVMFDEASRDRAKAAIRALADELDIDARAVREVLEEVRQGRYFMGIEAFLPAFAESLAPLHDYFSRLNARLFLLHPDAVLRNLNAGYLEALNERVQVVQRGDFAFAAERHFVSPREVVAFFEGMRAIDVAALRLSALHDGAHDADGETEAADAEGEGGGERGEGDGEDGSGESEGVGGAGRGGAGRGGADRVGARVRLDRDGNLADEDEGEEEGDEDHDFFGRRSALATLPDETEWVGDLPDARVNAAVIDFAQETVRGLHEQLMRRTEEDDLLKPLIERIEKARRRGFAFTIVCAGEGQLERVRGLLAGWKVATKRFAEGESPLSVERSVIVSSGVGLFLGELSDSVYDPSTRLAVLADRAIFGARKLTRKKSRLKGAAPTLRELNPGDYVVHVDHGIGLFQGLVKLVVNGAENDFVHITYRDNDRLYLPVDRLNLVRKYTGGESSKPRLDKLGGVTFAKTKARVKDAVLAVAAELLQIYAQREIREGFRFGERDPMYLEFEAAFPYEETPDQEKAINDVLRDMASPRPMDRLVCGDVGYGKTEVAIRAAYRAVLDGKQAAVLVPTTVLALQHDRTFRERLNGFPVRVACLSRFTPPADVKEILKDVQAGRVDVLIGTHRLLSKDVKFKDLGVLVVDEEQRFGVTHKEALKKMRANVDVLTLTATPIPRTLNQATVGLRDLSIIQSPPPDRHAVRTFVQRFESAAIQEIIERELRRGGQVFFVHNRIETIGGLHEQLSRLVPDARIAVAHGQMKASDLEDVMVGFIERRYDVLLCTALIESGIDIPTCNTIIINNADQFGLAQLYQLRGRVGRARERGYCYLFVRDPRQLTADAQRRLEAILENQALGSGFNVATQDLEIRGAGNLLGEDQSGQIEAVGYDLYSELLAEAVAEIKRREARLVEEGGAGAGAGAQGGVGPVGGRAQIEPEINLPVAAVLPESYVPDLHDRLSFYQRFASTLAEDEVFALLDEVGDRFGPPPDEVVLLGELMRIKIECRALVLTEVTARGGKLVFGVHADSPIAPDALVRLVSSRPGEMSLAPDMRVSVKAAPDVPVFDQVRSVLQALRACVTRPR